MKIHAIKIQVVLGVAILTQMGCHGGRSQQGQYLYPNVATQTQDLSTTGDAFARGNQQGNVNPGLANFIRGMQPAPGTVPGTTPGSTPGTTPGTTPGADNKTTNTSDGSGDGAQTFTVEMNDEPLWIAACKSAGGDPEGDTTDTDGDGITDDCETKLASTTDKSLRMVGLNPKVFNGAVVSTKHYYKEGRGIFGNKKAESSGSSILLTKEENDTWKKSKVLGGFGSGVDTAFDREAAKKFVALATKEGNDLKGLKKLYEIKQTEADFKDHFEIIKGMRASERGADVGFKSAAPEFALIRADNNERIPFALSEDGQAVSDLSGIASTVSSLRQDSEFLYIAETHVVVPAGGIELRVGNLMSDRTKALAGSKAGMFFVINDNNSVIVTSDLIQNANRDEDLKKSRGSISTPSKCRTAHIVIAYFADDKKLNDGAASKAIFAENVFYHDKKQDVWKPIPQEWLRVQPLDKSDKAKCELKDDEFLFSSVSSQLKNSGELSATNSGDPVGDKLDQLSALVELHDATKKPEIDKLKADLDAQKLNEAQLNKLNAIMGRCTT